MTEAKGGLSPTLLSLFFDSLSVLLKAGIPIQDCLPLMLEDTPDERLRALLGSLQDSIQETYRLCGAMEVSGAFPAYAVRMVELGEEAGRLEAVCASLSSYYETENNIRAQIKRSVLNPALLICVVAAVISFLVLKVLPIFSGVYSQLGIRMEETPMVGVALTVGKIAMGASLALLLLLAVSGLLLLTPGGKRFFLRLLDRAPFTKKLSYNLAVSRFASALSMLLTSGLDTARAMELSAATVQNVVLKERLGRCLSALAEGASLGETLSKNQVFGPFHTSILQSGIKAGAADQVLSKLSGVISEEASASMENALSLIEPILVGVLSVVIGVILLCIMLPLVGILSSIG